MSDHATTVRTFYTGDGGAGVATHGDATVAFVHGFPTDGSGRIGPPPGALDDALAATGHDAVDALVVTGVPDERDLWPDGPSPPVAIPAAERADRVLVPAPEGDRAGAPTRPQSWLTGAAAERAERLFPDDAATVAGVDGALTVTSHGAGHDSVSLVQGRPVTVESSDGHRVLLGGPRGVPAERVDDVDPVDLAVVDDHTDHDGPTVDRRATHVVAGASPAEYREALGFGPEWDVVADVDGPVTTGATAGDTRHAITEHAVSGATELPQPVDALRETVASLGADPTGERTDADVLLACPEGVDRDGDSRFDEVAETAGIDLVPAGLRPPGPALSTAYRAGRDLVGAVEARLGDLLGADDLDRERGR